MSKKNAPKYKKSRVKRRDQETYERIREFKEYLIDNIDNLSNWSKDEYEYVYNELDYLKSIMRTESRYWDECQEMAVIVFQNEENYFHKNRIFKRYLARPMRRMVEGLVRNEKFHFPFFEERDQFAIIEAHLMEKFRKFDYTKGFPAFSYYNTVIKNFCIQELKKIKKEKERTISYEKFFYKQEDLAIQSENYYELEYDESEKSFNLLKELAGVIIDELNEKEAYLDRHEDKLRDTEKVKLVKEIKVGNGLIEIFENARIYFNDESDEPIINNKKRLKDLILMHLENITNLEIKDVKYGIKAFKSIYLVVKEKYVEEES